MNGDCSRVGKDGRRGNEGEKRRVDGGEGECVRLVLGGGLLFVLFFIYVVDVFFECMAELDEANAVMDFAFKSVGDGSGFLGDDDGENVQLFGYADGTAVAETEIGVDVEAGSDGEDAPGGEDLVAADDDGTIVEGRVFEEQGFEKGGGNHSIDSFAGADKLFHLVGAFENDESAGFGLGHVHAGLDVGFEIDPGAFVDIAFPELETFEDGVACELGLGADEKKEFADFGLKDDDQGDEADTHDTSKDLAAETHVENVENAPGDIHDDENPENAYDVSAFEQMIQLIDKESHQEDVQYIDKTDLRKGEHVGINLFCYNADERLLFCYNE